jgi:hypothetical protein
VQHPSKFCPSISRLFHEFSFSKTSSHYSVGGCNSDTSLPCICIQPTVIALFHLYTFIVCTGELSVV